MGSPDTSPTRRSSTLALWLFLVLSAHHVLCQTLATTVPLILPSAIAYDSQGNLYLAETANHVIRKVDASGNITTIAGTGVQGFSGDGGPATSAQLDSPQGLAIDVANHLYIADTHNNRIRRLDLATGTLTTIAGSTAGFSGDSGSATSAQLSLPTSLAIDTDGNLYIADTRNHRIRKVTSTGTVTTIAGNGTEGFSGDGGPATSAMIDSPQGLAVDSNKNLYIADSHNHRIRKLNAGTGTITTLAGTGLFGFSGDNTSAVAANLALPRGLTADADGNLFIADSANHRIRRIDATTGIITTIAGTGTQNFSGDTGPAVSATLNSPDSPTTSPAGLVTFADVANQRIRQVAANTTINTIAGLGLTTPGALTLTAPNIIAYGSGKIIATLTTAANATGLVTFFDQSGLSNATAGTASLVLNTATLDISTFPAGIYNFSATYAGDQTHASAQSTTTPITIAPLALSVAIAPTSILYGQSIPSFTGTLAGVLPRDTANVAVSVTTTAVTLSPAGSYPITATLSGPAAGNYTINTSSGLTIAPAPTITTLTAPFGTPSAGQPVTLTAQVASTTTGNPTGTITLLDSGSPQLTVPVPATGNATLTINSLAPGTHTLSALYSGDINFTSSTSSASLITITSGAPSTSDFTLVAVGAASQTVVAGNSANFTFTTQAQGTPLTSPITLAASGLPSFATVSFNPAYIPPGTSTGTFTLTINTPKTNTQNSALRVARKTLLAILIFPILFLRRGKRALLTLLPLILLSGCGDRVYTGSQSTSPIQSYTITVTGTGTTASGTVLQHTATVTLLLQQS